jgi:GMP synthase-like glutamine amidotransferase
LLGTGKILAIQNDVTDPPHLVAHWLSELGFSIEVIRPYLGDEIPSYIPEGVIALIPLGGHMNANDDEHFPWLLDERRLLIKALAEDVPILGICLGAQLLAVAAGGRVEKAKTGEVGIYEIFSIYSMDSIDSNHSPEQIFEFSQPLPVAQWHEDEITILPDNAILLASSFACRNQIYRIGNLAYGLQFHPEIDLSIIKDWESAADSAFLESGKSTIQPEVERMQSQLIATWKPFIQRWGNAIGQSSPRQQK